MENASDFFHSSFWSGLNHLQLELWIQLHYNYCCYFWSSLTTEAAPREDMWHWLFDCLADAILKEQLHSLQFLACFPAPLCTWDLLQCLFALQSHTLSNTQASGGSQTLWLSVSTVTNHFPTGLSVTPPSNIECFALQKFRNHILVEVNHKSS